MKTLLIVLSFFCVFSSLAIAADHPTATEQISFTSDSFSAAITSQEWRQQPDIFFLAEVQQAELAGLPVPKIPAECVEGLRCSNSLICSDGWCENGRCSCP